MRKRSILGAIVLAMMLMASTLLLGLGLAGPAWASQHRAVPQARPFEDAVRALIVRYERGHAPKGTVLGASSVTGAQRANLKLGAPLGGRMWRIDFTRPVSTATAERVARQLASHPAVEFAEIDRRMTVMR